MTYLDAAAGKTEPPDLYAPDIPETCSECGADLFVLDADGTCPSCGAQIEP